MNVDLLPQALGLAAVGMAMVFSLLAALIAAVVVMSGLIDRWRQPAQPAQPAEAADDANAQAEMAAAVAAAIRHHRAVAGAGTGP